jgi:membrane fusion protein, multidrug efflux system
VGIRQVDEGQYLAAGTTVVTLQALDPIFIDFYIPQQTLSRLKVGQVVSATIDAYPGVTFKGKISSVNSKVDSASRNVQARGSFANADRRLIPGMYANVLVEYGDATTQITLPQTAITYNPYGNTVYVVQKNGTDDKGAAKLTVQQSFVKLGDTRGDQVAVLDGVKSGDEIVTAGQLKLRNGSPIRVDNKLVPTNDPSPTPPNE